MEALRYAEQLAAEQCYLVDSRPESVNYVTLTRVQWLTELRSYLISECLGGNLLVKLVK
jgi:hypothetical protein